MSMKGLCYIVLIVAFLMYFQQDPVFTVIIIVIGFGAYLFIKSRKKLPSRSGFFSFFSGKVPQQQDNKMDDLITLVMLQQLLNSPQEIKPYDPNERANEKSLERVKNEVLELLEGD